MKNDKEIANTRGDNKGSNDADSVAEAPEGQISSGKINVQLQRFFRAFSGPLPPPEALREYADIQPDLVPKIIKMAEIEQAHRHAKEKESLAADITDNKEKRHYERRG